MAWNTWINFGNYIKLTETKKCASIFHIEVDYIMNVGWNTVIILFTLWKILHNECRMENSYPRMTESHVLYQ